METHPLFQQVAPEQPKYPSNLFKALHNFMGGISTPVQNPMAAKYGRAYDLLISGDAHRYKEDIDLAISQYEEALKLRTDLTEAHVGIAKCYRRKGHFKGAITSFKQALSHNPFQKEVHIELGKCYNESGQLGLAIKSYEKAIKLDPKCVEAKFGLALILELNQEMDYASRLYQEIIALDSEFLPAYNNLGSIFVRLGLYTPAEKIFRELVEKAPEFLRGHLGLAMTLDKAGKRKEALDTYYYVLDQKPNARNVSFIEKRIVAIKRELGHIKTRNNTTLVLVK